jgi:hypothetical protein
MDRRALMSAVGLLLVPCFLLAGGGVGVGAGHSRFEAMFNFGDSLGDTGNICVNKSAANQLLLTFAQPPYGMTYFGHPTCRCSDGRLVVDFLGTHARTHMFIYSVVQIHLFMCMHIMPVLR